MAGRERIQARLENVQTVQPILSALRMIALGSYQAARRRQRSVAGYVARLGEVVAAVSPLLEEKGKVFMRRGHIIGDRKRNASIADATSNADDSTGKDACFTDSFTT